MTHQTAYCSCETPIDLSKNENDRIQWHNKQSVDYEDIFPTSQLRSTLESTNKHWISIFWYTDQEPQFQEYEGFEDDYEFQIEAPQNLDYNDVEYQGPVPVFSAWSKWYQNLDSSASAWKTYLHESLLAWRSETIHRPPQEVQGYRKWTMWSYQLISTASRTWGNREFGWQHMWRRAGNTSEKQLVTIGKARLPTDCCQATPWIPHNLRQVKSIKNFSQWICKNKTGEKQSDRRIGMRAYNRVNWVTNQYEGVGIQHSTGLIVTENLVNPTWKKTFLLLSGSATKFHQLVKFVWFSAKHKMYSLYAYLNWLRIQEGCYVLTMCVHVSHEHDQRSKSIINS